MVKSIINFIKNINLNNYVDNSIDENITKENYKIIDDKLYTVEEAAKILRCSKNTVYTWKHQRKLTANKSGGKLLFLGRELKKFLNI